MKKSHYRNNKIFLKLMRNKKITITIFVLALLFIGFLFMQKQPLSHNFDSTSSGKKHDNSSVYRLDKVPRSLPKFGEIIDVKEKKKQFFAYMEYHVRKVNNSIKKQRAHLIALQQKGLANMSHSDIKKTKSLQLKYKLGATDSISNASFEELLKRVDSIPAALALAQSANESAWGTSRFARQGNNMFGQWCFSKGCGIVPKRRNAGASHEVAAFKNVAKSVESYIHNLNTTGAYRQLRAIRAQLRSKNKPVTGHKLAEGLIKYSERGREYVLEIQSMIRSNKLSYYNQ